MDNSPTENRSLSKIQQHVMHLRYILTHHQLDEIDPPKWFLNELNMAEPLARIESREREKFRQKFEI